MVEKILSQWRFKIVQGALPNVPLKPDPRWRCKSQRNSESRRTIPLPWRYHTDMQTAVSAGMFPVGCVWGYRTAGELLESGAKILIDNPLDVLSIIENPQNL